MMMMMIMFMMRVIFSPMRLLNTHVVATHRFVKRVWRCGSWRRSPSNISHSIDDAGAHGS